MNPTPEVHARRRRRQRRAFVAGEHVPSLEALSPAMWKMLFDAAQLGSVPYNVQRLSTRRVLIGKGLLTATPPTCLTEEGKRALRVEWREVTAAHAR